MIKKLSSALKRYPKIHGKAKRVYNDFYFYSHSLVRPVKRMFSKDSKTLVDQLLIDYPMIHSGMVSKDHIGVVLRNLYNVLENNIEGDIVELGCNVGTTSLFIRKLLDLHKSEKQFHVYDSWEGLPDKTDKDKSYRRELEKESCKTQKEEFIHNFNLAKLETPTIHNGWFKDIPNNEYPEKIAFAFFDGDFYSSIEDSFKKVYPKLVPGARVTVHDYKTSGFLEGVEKACNDYLKGKPEDGTMTDEDRVGIMIKK